MELARRDRPDPPEAPDRKWVKEGQLAVRRHHQEPVGLGDPARHLGEELGPGHPDGDGQADPFEHLAPQAHRHLERRAGEPAHPANVEERLVDRQALHERRRLLEDLEDRLARLGIRRHPRLDDDRVRAQAPRLAAAHRRADATRLGLVAGRQHDPHPDDYRAAAQARVVALLDRGVEGVEVRMQDRGLARHEQMFPSRADGSAGWRVQVMRGEEYPLGNLTGSVWHDDQ
jgi:hypothetical protein